jgi:hypothetical protein
MPGGDRPVHCEEFRRRLSGGAEQFRSLGRQLCDTATAVSGAVTASVGTACIPLTPFLDDIFDAAMYQAKRAGGHGFRHHEGAIGQA